MQVATLAHHGRNVPSHRHDVDHGAWTVARLRDWLSTRHSLPIELALILGLYAAYRAHAGSPLATNEWRCVTHET